MAESEFELKMDDYVAKNVKVEKYIQYLDSRTNKWKSASGNLNENTKYKLNLRARNVGSETYVRNVQIRVVNGNPSRIQFYKDDTFAVAVSRLDGPVWPAQLNPTDGTNPGQATPYHVVPFMVKEGPDQYVPIAGIGLYAEIIPQGHAWSSVYASLD